ncbi:DUF397 domain-containing protein [Nocardia arthritidis]|uniref:DUF397 domain-containing protein n=1 Tax=Nocardia arthritidis TaxID=228602 RepID=A0A6G9Y5Z3_9NOCA|nr:DUF397 domain-containing protein [Nocardia arthritidis]QIS08665.1 DUF397 domain-containing protein [Nocardia arthritidis]
MRIDLSAEDWFKSRRSSGDGNCVEVAFAANSLVGVRDSKNPSGPVLVFTADEWLAFTDAMAAGVFHR